MSQQPSDARLPQSSFIEHLVPLALPSGNFTHDIVRHHDPLVLHLFGFLSLNAHFPLVLYIL